MLHCWIFWNFNNKKKRHTDVFKLCLFLPLWLQNNTNTCLFVFHYDQNLTGSGQYVQLLISEPLANTQPAAKPKKKLSQKLVSVFVVTQETTNEQNK